MEEVLVACVAAAAEAETKYSVKEINVTRE
jgi:hypothetical protein